MRHVVDHFPAGRNAELDARLLFSDWRSRLLKCNAPGPGIAITHGQPVLHWQRDQNGRLCLNLEDAWDDYTASVESFAARLRASPRRKIVLARWRKQRWVVEPFAPSIGASAGGTVMDIPLSASVAASQTTITTAVPAIRLPIASAQSMTANPPDPRRG